MKRHWVVILLLALMVVSALACTLRSNHVGLSAAKKGTSNDAHGIRDASPCAAALAQDAVCLAANARALEIMKQGKLEAITVVQDVSTGALVAFAASQPENLDVTTVVLPLSLTKVLLAASWYDNHQPESTFESSKGKANSSNPAFRNRVSVHEMLVGGSDSAGREMANALRKNVGSETVIKDLERYGFARRRSLSIDETFWGEVAPVWRTRLVPARAYAEITGTMKDSEWADVLSVGEVKFGTTALHLSRFMQAVGNSGVMLMPVAREESVAETKQSTSVARSSTRWLQEESAIRLQSAMRDTVVRGTARSISGSMDGTGWHIGGKTGTGPGPAPIGPQSDGWFAGLIFDPEGKAQFTVATFVRHGGPGGGNAAKISADLARFIIGRD